MKNFALIGAAGFVAPRHLKAIRDTDNRLVAALDLHDSVGVLDSYFETARFFTEFERFDRHLEKLRRTDGPDRVDFMSICSPNYLHDAHVRLALRLRADAICEKPLVISPWNLDQLAELEAEFGQRIYTVLQLRLLPSLVALREKIHSEAVGLRHDVCLTYMTRRGPWYHVSWKGTEEKSGGLSMNIGIHLFDLLLWLFGPPEHTEVHLNTPKKMAGALVLERARVSWYLSVDGKDLPDDYRQAGKWAFRSITVDGEEVEFSTGFTDLHTRVYENILAGDGFGIEDARPSIELVHQIRNKKPSSTAGISHPALEW